MIVRNRRVVLAVSHGVSCFTVMHFFVHRSRYMIWTKNYVTEYIYLTLNKQKICQEKYAQFEKIFETKRKILVIFICFIILVQADYD